MKQPINTHLSCELVRAVSTMFRVTLWQMRKRELWPYYWNSQLASLAHLLMEMKEPDDHEEERQNTKRALCLGMLSKEWRGHEVSRKKDNDAEVASWGIPTWELMQSENKRFTPENGQRGWGLGGRNMDEKLKDKTITRTSHWGLVTGKEPWWRLKSTIVFRMSTRDTCWEQADCPGVVVNWFSIWWDVEPP